MRAAGERGANDHSFLHRKIQPLDRRSEAAGGGAQAVPGEGRAAVRALGLGRSAWRFARKSGHRAGVPRRARERLQHQRRHHDARFRQRADVLVVHARRRHGPAGDDRLAQPHHRARSEDLPRAAVGARRRLDPVRRVFQLRRAVSFLAAASAAQAAAAPD